MSELFFYRSGPRGRSAARKASTFLGIFLLFLLPVSAAAQSAGELQENARQFVQYDDPVIAITGVQVVDGTGAAPAVARPSLFRTAASRAWGRTAKSRSPRAPAGSTVPGTP